jgi:hypothetical protein
MTIQSQVGTRSFRWEHADSTTSRPANATYAGLRGEGNSSRSGEGVHELREDAGDARPRSGEAPSQSPGWRARHRLGVGRASPWRAAWPPSASASDAGPAKLMLCRTERCLLDSRCLRECSTETRCTLRHSAVDVVECGARASPGPQALQDPQPSAPAPPDTGCGCFPEDADRRYQLRNHRWNSSRAAFVFVIFGHRGKLEVSCHSNG